MSKHWKERSMVKNSHTCISNYQMKNWRTDEMVFICNLTKISTDENKPIYSSRVWLSEWCHYCTHMLETIRRSSDVVVKLFTCGACRGLGLKPGSPHLDFRDWASPASKSPYDWKIFKATKPNWTQWEFYGQY